MDFQLDPLGPCLKRVTVTVSPDRVREEFDQQYEEINDKLVLPGFRKGHAPRKLLEKRFKTQIGNDVKEKLVKAVIEELVEEKKVEPLEPPQIDLEELEVEPEKALEFSFEILIKPEFETPEYKGVEVKVPAVEVSDAEVDHAVEAIRRRDARLEAVPDAEIGEDDLVVVDWKALSGDSVEAQDDNAWYRWGRGVLGGLMVHGLDEALKGQKAGARVTAKAHASADEPREELRDKEFDLQVEVKEVRRPKLPPVDEVFLKRHDFDDVEEMRGDLAKQIRRLKLRDRDRAAEQMIVDQLAEGVEMSLPEKFVSKELEHWAQRRRTGLQIEGVAEEEIDRRLEEERADAKKNVETDLRRYFLLERIAKAEDVKVSESELLQAIQEIARAYGHSEEEVLASYRDPERLAMLGGEIRHRKTRDLLLRAASVVESAPGSSEAPPEEAHAAEADEAEAAEG